MGVTVEVGRLSVGDVESLAGHLVEFMKPYLKVLGWSTR